MIMKYKNDPNISSEALDPISFISPEVYSYQKLENSIASSILVTNTLGKIYHINQSFERLLGYPKEKILGQRIQSFFGSYQENQDCLTPLPSEKDLLLVTSYGESIPVRIEQNPLEGLPLWVSTLIDMRECRKAEQSMGIFLKRCGHVLDALDLCISVCDHENHELLFANATYQVLFGSNNTAHIIFLNHFNKPQINSYPKNETGIKILYIPSMKKWFEIRVQHMPWVDDKRKVTMIATVDVSNIKKEEEIYQSQQKKAQEVSRLVLIGEMASSLAHELNQPLTAIMNYSSGCMKQITEKSIEMNTIHSIFQKISTQAYRSGRIIKSIRNFVKKNKPHFSTCCLEKILKQTIAYMMEEYARENIEISAHLLSPLPMKLYADEILIEQLLINLMKNAIEAGNPKKKNYIQCSLDYEDSILQIGISDQGIGLNKELQEKIFSPFFSTKKNGMGMGLNICRTIVEYHQGRISATSNLTGGTTFYISMPMESNYEHK